MVILQAIFSLVTRSLGKIVSALFGWAVTALFGRTAPKETPYLSALVGAAALWPLLLLGTFFPRIATFAFSFIPVGLSVPAFWLRAGWIALALLVPFVVGVSFSRRAPARATGEGRLVRLARGFPITLGVAAAFLFVLVTVPLRKLVAVARKLEDEHVPLLVLPEAHQATAALIEEILDSHGFALERREPSWAMRAPTAILRALGGASIVPALLACWRGPAVEIVLQPHGVTLRGARNTTARAHGLLDEAFARSRALQTTDPAARRVEAQIKDVWRVFEANPAAHRDAGVLLGRIGEIAEEIVDLAVPYEDWSIVYRQALQLSRAVHGGRPLLEKNTPTQAPAKEEIMYASGSTARLAPRAARGEAQTTPALEATGLEEVPLRDLLGSIVDGSRRLLEKKAALVKAELEKDLATEVAVAKSLAIAAVLSVLGVALLLVSAVFGLAQFMPAWAAALLIGGPLLVVGLVLAAISWKRRLHQPLEISRQTWKESLQWARNRFA